jgi:hypothetical protein
MDSIGTERAWLVSAAEGFLGSHAVSSWPTEMSQGRHRRDLSEHLPDRK